MQIQALLLIWTVVHGGSDGTAVSQTTTPLPTMEICQRAKSAVEFAKVKTPRPHVSSIVTTECVPLSPVLR